MKAVAFVVLVGVGVGCSKQDGDPAPSRVATGSAQPMTEAAYAQRLIAEIRKRGGSPEITFEPSISMIVADGTRLWITNLYAEYLRLPEAAREAAIAQVVTTMTGFDEPPKQSLATVRTKLLPVVRAGLYFDFDLLEKSKPDAPALHAAIVPIGEATSAGIAIDDADSMQIATDKQLGEWGLTADAALAIAVTNLAHKGTPFETVQPGVWTSPAHDNYDASRLLLIEEIERLGLKGTVVALIPNRDTIYLADAQDAAALLAMAKLAEKASDEPRPIHTIPLCLSGKIWNECEPAPTPEIKRRMHALATLGRQSLYAEQQDPLSKRLGEDVFVATLTVYEDQATKGLASYATWTRTVPTLLPRADQIAFVVAAGDNPDDAKMLGTVPWARVMAVMGPHLKPDGRSPPRWATGDSFPTAAELEKLAPSDVPRSK